MVTGLMSFTEHDNILLAQTLVQRMFTAAVGMVQCAARTHLRQYVSGIHDFMMYYCHRQGVNSFLRQAAAALAH